MDINMENASKITDQIKNDSLNFKICLFTKHSVNFCSYQKFKKSNNINDDGFFIYNEEKRILPSKNGYKFLVLSSNSNLISHIRLCKIQDQRHIIGKYPKIHSKDFKIERVFL